MKDYNIIISGYGGQGVITLVEILSKAALKHKMYATEAELHGLAQRGGSLECHIRFGKHIHSPIIPKGSADMIIALEAVEALRALYWANKNTVIILNSKVFRSEYTLNQIVAELNKITKNIYTINADEIAKKETGNITGTNLLMLGYALKKGLLPLKKELVWKAIEEKIKPQFLEETKRLFNKI